MTEKLIEALRFYADPATYQGKGHPQIDADMKPINYDRGAIAREAIRYHEAEAGPRPQLRYRGVCSEKLRREGKLYARSCDLCDMGPCRDR